MSRAAEELDVTQGAVSRAIQALEKDLGTLLFRRSRPLLQLTEAGEVLHVDVKRGFERLSAGVKRVRELGQSGRLAIDVLPTFAIRFLIPRLPRLQALHPEFDVDLTVSERAVDFDVDPIDIAIRYGMDGQWPHAGSTRLMEEELVFVCAPAVRGRYGALTPDMLEPQLLLRHTTRPETWPEWFAAAGLESVEPRGLGLEHFFMVIEAAIAGMGFALLPRFMIQRELEDGSLIVACAPILRRRQGYHVLFSPERRFDTRVVAIVRWLRAEIHRDSLVSSGLVGSSG